MSEITSRLDAVEIIGQYVPLRQTGKTWKGLCPFHPEKTPSFNVNRERGLWYCFGCGIGGDLVSFVMKIENIPFPEARERLAQRAGVVLPKYSAPQNRKRVRLEEVLEVSTSYYRQMLSKSSLGQEGLRYLTSRGVSPEMIEKFSIGLSPSGGQGLINYLKERNFTLHEIQEAGLATRSDPPRDYFYKRIMFPIWDSSGKVIAFGGRILGPGEPKYLNSPETPLFKKGENLFAFHVAKPEILKTGFALLAEGYLDVVALHQFGISQAVATLGTSLTSSHAKFLARFTSKLVFVYDGDRAGNDAMVRAISVVGGTGLDMECVILPEKEDPDTFIHKNGSAAFRELLKSRLSPVDFIFNRARSSVDATSPEGKKKIVDATTPLLSAIADPVLKDAYVRKISQSLDITESSIRKRIGGKRDDGPKGQPRKENFTEPSRERDILSWILWEPPLAALVWSSLTPDDFQEGGNREAARALHRLWTQDKRSVSELDQVPELALSLLSRLGNEPPIGKPENVAALVSAQKAHHAKKELHTLKAQITARLKEGKVDPTDEAYRKYVALLQSVKKS